MASLAAPAALFGLVGEDVSALAGLIDWDGDAPALAQAASLAATAANQAAAPKVASAPESAAAATSPA